MRGLVFICASAVLSVAPAWAQQAHPTDASHSRSQAAQHPASASHKSLNPIGQALADLLNEARRPPSPQAADDAAAGANNAAARASEVETAKTGESAPVEVAVH